MTKLEIKAESDADLYDIKTTVKCYECGGVDVDATSPKVSVVLCVAVNTVAYLIHTQKGQWRGRCHCGCIRFCGTKHGAILEG